MSGAKQPLTAEVILAAAESVIRRHGPSKATVVDVARELGVSHTAVYKHFSSKQALREAVTQRWLEPNRKQLAVIAGAGDTAPAERLRAWLHTVLVTKREKAASEPELFAAYGILAAENSAIAEAHVKDLLSQLAAIVAAGIADGTFAVHDAAAAGRAIFDATTRFHHLAHVEDWRNDHIVADLDAVCTLLLDGLAR